ncbi:LOW QUALITY PROTEIN: pentatricopeptide repeat-containing protein At3g12770-like [Dioscorea cayenensis subsp. rotundata]|uniref:LOW QUALITY PROTEIN: pentatricopeptide repeat-containing protein At3g12770-like n=1 Tax=Dioscorea cayennensis subsp. rotundata TaxID=55577 RepID=A0AB40BCI9_DIOCR|nr:LOW QUALITY PROTEIN: pentatricopeptide repeat-containing protein At3g12770-like [Dioscorea cayenensis subsp. rotundata]
MLRAIQLKPSPLFPPGPSVPFKDLLNSCPSISSLQCIHAQFLIHGLCNHLALTTKLISLASMLSQSMCYARKLFDALPHPDSFSWNSLIRGYADLGPCTEVPLLYKEMHHRGLSPDHFTFPFVVRSCAVLTALQEGKQVHCNVIKHGFRSNVYVQSSLITMYACSGEIHDSETIFDGLEMRNIVSWTAMVACYAQNGAYEKALAVFRWMVASRVQPNEVTLVSVLPACEGIEYLPSGKSIHAMVIKSGLRLYLPLVNALIAMYGKCGNTDSARQLFEGMEFRSLVSWNTMIAMFEQSGYGGKAIKLFRRMLTEKVRFDSVTLVSVISACTRLGALDTGKWMHELARSKGLESDVRIGNALLDMYAKCGSLECARNVFTRITSRDVVSWSAIIGAYATHGQAEDVLELFSQMKAEGVRPNSFTFTSVLAACSHSGLVEEGVMHFDSVRRDYGITPTIEHCACLVDLLGRAGQLNEALEFIRRMPVKPDSGIWGALLGACRIHVNVELAELVAQELFQLDPHNVTFYVLMSNIYAEAGRWEDAARLRKMMMKQDLKKIPGYSLVDIIKKYH